MSADDLGASMTTVCASCGIAEINDVKLKDCNSCDLVRYCSDECQKNHKSEHEEECKKRATELRDELLFRQPESSFLGDCPICCLPLPLDMKKSTMYECCSKVICIGCHHANEIREEIEIRHTCPFCRKPGAERKEEAYKQRMKRVEADDPVALCVEGALQYNKKDYFKAFEYYAKAAELGNIDSHFKLAVMYDLGLHVKMNGEKKKYHLVEAAIGGHPMARYNLGVFEWNKGDKERAVKHFVISATQGHDLSMKTLMDTFRRGLISKEDLAAALRAHQAAVDATKSPQREAAEKYHRK